MIKRIKFNHNRGSAKNSRKQEKKLTVYNNSFSNSKKASVTALTMISA